LAASTASLSVMTSPECGSEQDKTRVRPPLLGRAVAPYRINSNADDPCPMANTDIARPRKENVRISVNSPSHQIGVNGINKKSGLLGRKVEAVVVDPASNSPLLPGRSATCSGPPRLAEALPKRPNCIISAFSAQALPHSSFVARRAPSANDASLAHTIVGCTSQVVEKLAKPQSAPAMTCSRPTT
jgi:Periplasmic binding protein domain